MSSRRFSEKEVAEILKRAAELQIEAPGSRSVSLEELELIAVEAGMDAALVRRAANEVSRGETVTDAGWLRALLGGPPTLKWEFDIPGEINADSHERILEAIHSTLSEPGHASTTGRTLTWNIVSQSRKLGVTVTPKDGRTLVRVEDHLGNLIGGIYGGVGGGGGGSLTPLAAIAGGALLGPVGVGIGVAAGLLASYGVARAIYGAVTGRREEKMKALVGAIQNAVEASVPDLAAAEVDADMSTLAGARERHGLRDAPPSSAERELEAVSAPHEQEQS